MKWNLEIYRCAILTVIAILLAAILWHMPPQPLTMEKVRTAKMKGWQNRIPLVYVGEGDINVEGGNITVDDFESPMPVQIEP